MHSRKKSERRSVSAACVLPALSGTTSSAAGSSTARPGSAASSYGARHRVRPAPAQARAGAQRLIRQRGRSLDALARGLPHRVAVMLARVMCLFPQLWCARPTSCTSRQTRGRA